MPYSDRSFYLLIGQFNNEIVILNGLLLQAFSGLNPNSESRAVTETSLGMALFLARLLSGRLYEFCLALNTKDNSTLLDKLWSSDHLQSHGRDMLELGLTGKKSLNSYFGKKSLLHNLRNKLAYHIDPKQLDLGFAALPDNIQLTDFHTGRRGTTFFGAADTLTLYAVAKLAEQDNALSAAHALMDEVLAAVNSAGDYVDAYMYAFTVAYFGEERLKSMEREFIRNTPSATGNRIRFFMRGKKREAR